MTPQTPPTQPAKPPVAAGENPFLEFNTPAGWGPGKTSSMRKASFAVVDGAEALDISVIDFPSAAGVQIGEVGPNVQRWAGEVGRADISPEEIEEVASEISIDGIQGTFVNLLDLVGEEAPNAVLAAMVERESRVWFFKMSGPAALVKTQQDAFREFLASVRFK
jgi:hypothetical protein